MMKSKILAAACADRTIKFYDLEGTQPSIPVSCISEMDGMPLCIDYYFSKEKNLEYLIVGDDLGICHIYEFKPGDWHACFWNM